MKNLLLNSTLESLVPVFIVAGFLILAIVIFLLMTRKKKKGSRIKHMSDIDTSKSMGLRIPFLNSAENNFLYNFQSILPGEYVVYPKVSMQQLIVPFNNLNFYNAVKDRVIDYVVFMKKNMQPVVIIDLHDRSGVQKSIEEDDKYLGMALRNVGLPIVDYEIRQEYEPAELLGRFLDALDPVAIANLKKNNRRF